MNKGTCSRWGIAFGILTILLLCIAAAALLYFQRRSTAFNSRPLVLIHSPFNHDAITIGEAVLVHATAREDGGLRRMELWADDQLIAARDAPAGATTLTLAESWNPGLPGTHVIVARAISSVGTHGQSTVMIEAAAAANAGPDRHTAEEGETLESIAAEHGVTPEELAASNPGLAPASPGQEWTIPEEGAPGPAAAPEAGEAPSESTGSPGSANPFEGLILEVVPLDLAAIGEGEPISLRLEVISLQTSQAFDGLHCYAGLADATPRWLPDADGDQTTDESFPTLAGGGWDVQPYLAGSAAPFLTWPGNQNLPFDISCVGMAGGGTDSLDLGRMQLSIPPSDWDGVPRLASSEGEGGRVDMQYKVSLFSGDPPGFPAWLDNTMAAPNNVHLDDRRTELHWDYTPLPGEEPISGFRVYLNGNLQWTEAPSARASGIPYEWFHPRCGSPYTFGVTAYRDGYPDGPESPSGTVMVVTPVGECDREIQVIFRSLETFELGGDGSPDHISGDVGPVYGNFYANEQQIKFDTRGPSGSGGSLDMPVGLYDNTVYDLNELWLNPSWQFSSMPGTVVDVSTGGSFEFGFFVMDDDRSRDELACAADSMIYVDQPGRDDLDQWHDGTLMSDDGRCRLNYSFGPAMGSTVGSGVAGSEPLPWLDIENITIDGATGAVSILVRNTGTATWPWKPLAVELRTRAGQAIERQVWDNFVLETGQERTLEFPAGIVSAPFDACVVLDPDNNVIELYERTGALSHGPACPQLPDLTISGVTYGSGVLHVTVENVGEGVLEDRTVVLDVSHHAMAPLELHGSWANITLGPREVRVFDIGDIDDATREVMRDGYTVTVDPDETLAESSKENNSYDVETRSQGLWLYWRSIQAPYDQRRHVSYTFDATALSGEARRQVAHWQLSDPIEWSSCFEDENCTLVWNEGEYEVRSFEVYGDEQLQVTIRASHAGEDDEDIVGVETYSAVQSWGAGPLAPDYACQFFNTLSPSVHVWTMDYFNYEPWTTIFYLCSYRQRP